jgi:two-component system sensor histidine kinase HydH
MVAVISPTLRKLGGRTMLARHSFLVRTAVVGTTLAGISAAQNLVPFSLIHWQFVLQRLYYLPIILAALQFGWRGGIIVAALSGLSYARSIISASNTSAYDLLDVNLEVMVFCVMGVMTGILADREYRQKRALQETTKELSRVYRELQENFDRMKRTERLMCGQGCCTPSREQTAWVP